MDAMILRCWAAGYVSNVRIRPLKSIPSIGFLHAGGKLNQIILINALKTLDKKAYPAVEVMLHPGTGDPYTHSRYRHWRYNWKNDLDLSVDPLTVQLLEHMGITPVSFVRFEPKTNSGCRRCHAGSVSLGRCQADIAGSAGACCPDPPAIRDSGRRGQCCGKPGRPGMPGIHPGCLRK